MVIFLYITNHVTDKTRVYNKINIINKCNTFQEIWRNWWPFTRPITGSSARHFISPLVSCLFCCSEGWAGAKASAGTGADAGAADGAADGARVGTSAGAETDTVLELMGLLLLLVTGAMCCIAGAITVDLCRCGKSHTSRCGAGMDFFWGRAACFFNCFSSCSLDSVCTVENEHKTHVALWTSMRRSAVSAPWCVPWTCTCHFPTLSN